MPSISKNIAELVGTSGTVAITGDELQPNVIRGNNIVAGTITGNLVAGTTLTGDLLASNIINANNIVNGTITGAKIAATTITGDLIAANTIRANNIVNGVITGDKIASATIGSSNLTTTGVSSGNYGGASAIGVFTVGTDGRITYAANVSISAGGDYVMQVFNTPGTWTKPANIRAVKVTVVGGGGGTPGGTSNRSAGGGGGAAIEYIDAPCIPGPQPYTVGAAGAAGPNVNLGNAGGTSSFGSPAFLSATGGGVSPVSPGAGSGGAGSNGQLNFPGGDGNTYVYPTPCGVSGYFYAKGSSILSSPSVISTGGVLGNSPGVNYGQGGAGVNQSSGVGANGGAGVIIVEEFY